MRLKYTGKAVEDLKAIQAYISRDSPTYARRVIRAIRTAVQRLTSFPESGGVVEEWNREDIRQVLVGNYRVIYEVARTEVRVIAVIHGARQLPGEAET